MSNGESSAVIGTPAWVRERAMFRFDSVDPRRTALLVIDLQKGFIDPKTAAENGRAVADATAIIPAVNRLASQLRSSGGMVIFIRHTGSDEPARSVAQWQKEIGPLQRLDATFRVGREAHALDPRLDVGSNDLLVDKYRYSAFIAGSSDLEERLGELGIDTIIVTGAFSNYCCESTARDGMMLGFRVFFAADANVAHTPEEHQMAIAALQLAFADIRTTDEIITMIRDGKTSSDRPEAHRRPSVDGGTVGDPPQASSK